MAGVTRSDPLIFIDTETTGLHKARRPWEIALIRRSDIGQTRLLLCVDVRDLELEDADPEGLRISGFHRRHPQARDRPLLIPRVYRAADAAGLVQQWTAGATLVGVVTRFDTECLADMFARHGMTPAWNDDLVDVVPRRPPRFALQAESRHPMSRTCPGSAGSGRRPRPSATPLWETPAGRCAGTTSSRRCDGRVQSRE